MTPRKISSIFLFSTALVSCGTHSRPTSESQAREVAAKFARSIDPRIIRGNVTVQDSGADWLVIYHGRRGWAGGENKIWVNKKRMQVSDYLFPQ